MCVNRRKLSMCLFRVSGYLFSVPTEFPVPKTICFVEVLLFSYCLLSSENYEVSLQITLFSLSVLTQSAPHFSTIQIHFSTIQIHFSILPPTNSDRISDSNRAFSRSFLSFKWILLVLLLIRPCLFIPLLMIS